MSGSWKRTTDLVIFDVEGVRPRLLRVGGLLANLHYGQDVRGEKAELFYVRDKEKMEVDFLTVVDKTLCHLVEVKLSDESFSPSLSYFTERLLPKKSVQVVLNLSKERQNKSLCLVKAENYLASLE